MNAQLDPYVFVSESEPASTVLALVASTYGIDPAAISTTSQGLWVYDPQSFGRTG